MRPLVDQVRHDAASLYQFVSSIASLCESRNPAAAYLPASERFFRYLEELGRATKRYVQDFPGGRTQAIQYLDMRDEIAVLRASWQFLHAFLKPALDSDTLHQPSSLIEGLTTRFRQIDGYSSTDFAIFHTDEFNYFNVRLHKFNKVADSIASIVQGPKLPEKLALIGIPYSQSSSIFMNCLIPHEMGHYLYGAMGLGSRVRRAAEQELLKNFGTQLKPLDRIGITGILTQWSEELFCDLFAVRLVGFCYPFAYIELFDGSKALDGNSAFSSARASGMTDFDESYPPDLFRLKQQVEILVKDQWWSDLVLVDSHYVKVLEAAKQMTDTDFDFPGMTDPDRVLKAFFTIVPKIFSELESLTTGLGSACGRWKTEHVAVESYLEHGVVPSSLLEKEGEAKFNQPDSIALVNSAYKFYVESLHRLLAHIKDADDSDVRTRSEWASKVEVWTAKAIEDIGLLTRKGLT